MGKDSTNMDTDVRRRLAWMCFGACTLIAAASFGLWWFTQAAWFWDHGPYDKTSWGGFTLPQLIGLTMFVFFAPIGFTLLVVVFQHHIRASATTTKCRHGVTIAIVCAVLLAGFGVALVWSAGFFECMGFACAGPTIMETVALDDNTNSIYGFKVTIGASFAIITLLISGVVMGGCILAHSDRRGFFTSGASSAEEQGMLTQESGGDAFDVTASTTATNGTATSESSSSSSSSSNGNGTAKTAGTSSADLVPAYEGKSGKRWGLYSVWVLACLVWWIPTSVMPASWEFFKPDRIAYNAAGYATEDTDDCGSAPPRFCAELAGATFHTMNIEISSYYILKIFPSTIIFNCFMIGVPFFALLSYDIASIRRKFAGKVKCCGSLFSVAEMFFFFAFLVLCGFWSYYWMHDHNFHGRSTASGSWEHIFRGFGQLGVLVMALLILPAGRSSLIAAFFRISWEATVQYHRWLGTLWLFIVGAHIIFYWVFVGTQGSLSNDWWPLHYTGSLDNFTVPLQMTVMIFAFVSLIVFAVWDRMRRQHFEWFYYMHHVTYCVLIMTVLWHAAAAWMYLLPGVGMWFIDRLLRIYRSSRAVRILSFEAHQCGAAGNVVEIVCEVGGGFKYAPGQFAFLNVSEISVLEWHPFTIASATAGRVRFLISAMDENGPDTWTCQLYKLATSKNAANPTLCVDGPAGEPIDYSNYKSVILVSGGIGVTPCASIFNSLKTRHASDQGVHFVWSARDKALFGLLSNELSDVMKPSGTSLVTAQLFKTSGRKGAGASAENKTDEEKGSGSVLQNLITEAPSRVDFNKVLSPLAAKGNDGDDDSTAAKRTLLFVCGPGPMTASLEELAHTKGWSFHTETFEL